MAAAPFFIDDADIGVERIPPNKDSYRSQIMAVALRLGDLMTIATKAYKAGSTTMVDGCLDFPALPEVMGGSSFNHFHMSHRAYLETWYHVAAMLACRYNGPGTRQYNRRLKAADRVLAIVSREGCEGLPPLPLVPYAMSMSTTVIYRALHDGARDIDTAREDLHRCCDVLDDLSQRWTSVRGVAKLAKRLCRLIDDGTLITRQPTSRGTTDSTLPVPANISVITDQVGNMYSDEAFQRQLSEIWPSFDATYTQMDWALNDYGFDMEFPSSFDNFSS
ncbi:hypothetical protein G6011_02414 [Alternaria panax]|uniref:Uncharacterized protein n=1 Tax=Alternaria panax TaxID=48097 RepID=A0AAD4FGX9_9PLEO|nr:hypothetical protein G6011_02414 [Alternaria panax]